MYQKDFSKKWIPYCLKNFKPTSDIICGNNKLRILDKCYLLNSGKQIFCKTLCCYNSKIFINWNEISLTLNYTCF